MPGARTVRPDDFALAKGFIAALERTHQLYQQTGRKLVVANFANILLAILAPTARRLIADRKADDFLWDGWRDGTESSFDLMLA